MPVVAPEVIPTLSDEDSNERVAHIIKKSDWGKGYVMGEAVQALCGKMWVPHKDPQGLTTCSRCAEVFKELTGQDFG